MPHVRLPEAELGLVARECNELCAVTCCSRGYVQSVAISNCSPSANLGVDAHPITQQQHAPYSCMLRMACMCSLSF